ncbi:MAG: hypothetical protein PHH26_03065 [Candidatus Thermoplasmatota archaeon]|nr:hypothetical protein [Candidatus Thermoplasmatota archaeon]
MEIPAPEYEAPSRGCSALCANMCLPGKIGFMATGPFNMIELS